MAKINIHIFRPGRKCDMDILQHLSAHQRENLLSIGRHQQISKNDFIFASGAPGDSVYLILDGRAKIFEISEAGREVIIWFCLPGEMFGVADTCLGNRRDVFAQACNPMRVVRIMRSKFRDYLLENPEFMLLVVDLLASRLRILSNTFFDLSASDVASRLVRLLARLFQHYGRYENGVVSVNMNLTHQDMADMIGASRQTVTRILADLKQHSAVSIISRRLSIKARDADQAAISVLKLLH